MHRHLARAVTALTATAAASAAALALAGAPASAAVPVQVFNVPSANSGLQNIIAGPDGNLWFTEENSYKVGKLTTSGQIDEFSVPSNTEGVDSTGPTGITAGSDGDLWFLTDIGETLDRMDTSGNLLGTVYADRGYNADALTWGTGGSAWLFEDHGDEDDDDIIHVSPASGGGYSASEGVPDSGFGNDHSSIATAADGTVYFNQHNSADYLDWITPDGMEHTIPLGLPQPTQESWDVAVGPDGTPWFTVQDEGAVFASYPGVGACCGMVGHVTASGVHLYPIGAQVDGQGLLPNDIVAGPDGAMWFSFISAYKNGFSGIGRVTSSGQVQLLNLSPYKPTSLAFGSDGDLYFIDNPANSIGRIQLGANLFSNPTGTPAFTKPALTVPANSLTRLRSSRKLATSCRLSAAGTCAITATVSASSARGLGLKVARNARTVKLAAARGTLKKAGTARVTLTFPAATAKRFAKVKSLALTLTATASAKGRASATSSRTLTLRR